MSATDEPWPVPEPLLPKRKKPGRPPAWTRRQRIDGIRFRARTGIPWRDMPERYGPWMRAHDLFSRQHRDGTWHRVLSALQGLRRAQGLGRVCGRQRPRRCDQPPPAGNGRTG
ncbi:transposase [Streptomyces sp. NPDC058683]|uniref:transposase n=1 Tax=Streptomyces sp. NPDC058683 TaxID=3346597 RepID=UPI00365EE0F5